jgi:ABC-type polar amino acid transport system ATPase subunit
MNILEVNNITKQFDGVTILKDLSVSFEQGTITSIIGPSGSGKSTFLRCLNQLETIQKGDIYFEGLNVTDRHTDINLVRQRIGMVFQSFHLFHNLTVLENIMIGPTKVQKREKEEIREQALQLLEQVGLVEFRDRLVTTLSGGQKQRVAIARTLCMNPDVILFDEPTSSLDPLMVGEVLEVIQQVATKDFTIIIVTHEMAFAKDISDRVLYMDQGKIVVDGSVEDVFIRPTNPQLRQFINRFI